MLPETMHQNRSVEQNLQVRFVLRNILRLLFMLVMKFTFTNTHVSVSFCLRVISRVKSHGSNLQVTHKTP